MAKRSSSATGSLGGYLYQCEITFLHFLRHFQNNPNIAVAVEIIDDAQFEENGTPIELLQVKHQIKRVADLTKTSIDFWKTVGNWIDAVRSRGLDPENLRLTLVTTGQCDGTNGLAFLKSSNERDVEAALGSLRAVALSVDESQTIYPHTQKFSALTPEEQKTLFDAIVLVDAEPQIADLDVAWNERLRLTCDAAYLKSMRQALRGWWYERVYFALSKGSEGRILGAELEGKLSDLRSQHREDNLPIDGNIRNKRHKISEANKKLLLVKQLNLISQTENLIEGALNDYFHAYAQRSKWSREGILKVGEIGRYENKLVEEWTRLFERMKRDLGEQAAESEIKKKGLLLLESLEDRTDLKMRERFSEQFVSRGTLHGLSNKLKLGWHANFKERLASILKIKAAKEAA